MKLLIALPLFALWQQTPAVGSGDSMVSYGVSGGVTALVLYLWRQDRQDRQAQKAEDDKRYAALAADFRAIVEANTTALVKLEQRLEEAEKGK